jgi:ribosome-binding factor A
MVSERAVRRRSLAAERGPSQRGLRVAEELRHALAKILCEGVLRDPALDGASITVSEVRLSPDLRNATAYVMPLGGTRAPEIMAGLARSAPFVRGLLARTVPLRQVPNLAFELDRSFDQAAHIAAILARPEVERDLRPQDAAAKEPDDE